MTCDGFGYEFQSPNFPVFGNVLIPVGLEVFLVCEKTRLGSLHPILHERIPASSPSVPCSKASMSARICSSVLIGFGL